MAFCLANWILIHDGTSQYRMENKYWQLKLFLFWSVPKSYALYVLALCPIGRLQFPVAQPIIWVVCLYTIRRIPAIPMTAALQSWERISPGLQTGMLPFMAVSACSWGLACTRRYVPADLKQRWLKQLQWPTRKVCWGRKASCQEDFVHCLWLFLPDCLSTPCSVLRWGKMLCLPLWDSLGSIQGAVATLPYRNKAGKNFSNKYEKTWHDWEVFSAKELLGIIIWCWLSLFFCWAVNLSVCLLVFFCWIISRREVGKQVLFKCSTEKPQLVIQRSALVTRNKKHLT